ncbi:MAG: MFS transporter [Actinomycetota bacterium]|nr:MFS transporter [Actinomycetota bacterium]
MDAGTGGASRGGRVLVAALVVDSLGHGLFLPLSLVYFTQLTDVPLGLLGVLLSAATAVTLPVPVWAGALADRFGALPLVVAAQLLQAAGFLGYAQVRGPAGILLAAGAVAIGVRIFWSTIFTAVADYADGSAGGRSRDSWYGVSNAARTAGLAAGGLLTGAVVADGREGTYRAVAYGAAFCFAVAAVLIAAFVRVGKGHEHEPLARSGYATLVRDVPYLGLIAVNTVYAMTSMLLALALPTVVLTGIRGPAWLTAVILAGNAVLVTVLSAAVVRRLARFRRTRSIVAAASLWAGFGGLLATLPPGRLGFAIPVLVIGGLLFTAAEVVHAPISTALAAAAAPPAARGRYLAAFQYSFALASIVAPAFFATLYEVHMGAPWLALAAVNLASIPLVLLLERTLPRAAVLDAADEAPHDEATADATAG